MAFGIENPPHKDESEQMRYLRLGLDAYNKYLRRQFKYQLAITILKNFISNMYVQLPKKGMK